MVYYHRVRLIIDFLDTLPVISETILPANRLTDAQN